MSTKQQIEIGFSKDFTKQLLKVGIAIFLIIKLQTLIFYLLFALLFAVALSPLITWLQTKGLKHSMALALSVLMLVGLIFSLVGVIAVSLINTVSTFINDLPIYIDGFRQYELTAEYVDDFLETYENVDIGSVVQTGLSSGSTLLSGVSKAFEAILFTFFFTVYMLLERNYLMRIVRRAVPKSWKPRMRDLEKEFVEVVGSYIRGQLLTSFLMGLASYLIFRALGIPNAFALGIIAGITDIIPVIGGLIGLIPATLVALTISPATAILCIIFVQTYSTGSNYFIRPKIFGKALDMSPFIVTVATVAGLLIFGIPGIILALPGAAMLSYILTKYYNVPLIEDEYND